MPRVRLFPAVAALALAALLLPSVDRARAAGCPSTQLVFCSNPDCLGYEFNAPSGYGPSDQPWSAGSPCPGGCYDLPHGTLHAEGIGDPYGPGNSADVTGADAFLIQNVAGSDPVPALVVLLLDGSTTGAASVSGWVQKFGDQGSRVEFALSSPQTIRGHEVRMNVEFTPGQPLVLQYHVGAGGFFPAGTAQLNGRLLFANLPDQAYVTSCWQYDLFPVPIATTSWGKVKSVYR